MLSFARMGRRGGRPIVFLHGIGISSWMWLEVAARLPEADVILVDLPGHGGSRDVAWRSMADSAAQVVAVLDHLGLDQVRFVGLSLGGYVALHALAAYPHRFCQSVISGVHAGALPQQTLMTLMAWVMAPMVGWRCVSARTAKQLGGPDVDVAAFQRDAARTRPSAFRRAAIQATRFELPAGLDRYHGGLTLCCGGQEHLLIRRSLSTISGSVPHTQTVVVQGGGHGWPVARPDEFVPLVLEQRGAGGLLWVDGGEALGT